MAETEAPPPEGAPEWMVSYADMITIMMAFFVVMYSMAGSKDDTRQQQAVESIQKRFSLDSPLTLFSPDLYRAQSSRSGWRGDWASQPIVSSAEVQSEPEASARSAKQPRMRGVRPEEHPLKGGTVFFDLVQTELTGDQMKRLKTVADELAGKRQKIEIRGHAWRGPLPPGTPYANHWDLAYARCKTTMEHLVSLGVDPARIRLGVAAGNEPSFDPAGQVHADSRDSRVDVFMLSETIDSEPAADTARVSRPTTDDQG